MPPQLHPTIESAPETSSSNPQNAETSGVVLPPASSIPIPFPPVSASASAPAYLLPNPIPSLAPPLASAVKQLNPISTGVDEVVNLAKMDSISTAPPSEQIVVPASGPENGVQSTEVNDEEEGSGVLHWFQHTVQQYEFLSKVATKAKACCFFVNFFKRKIRNVGVAGDKGGFSVGNGFGANNVGSRNERLSGRHGPTACYHSLH